MSQNIDEKNNMPLQTPSAAVLVKEQPVLLETMDVRPQAGASRANPDSTRSSGDEAEVGLRGGDNGRGGCCPGRFCFCIPCPLPFDCCCVTI
ncbi:hypothetical protein MCOR25_000816 [Pyricularia grisea]|nr:hypothetical protein MCOR25_000816 [Pyricularia grisea]